MDSEGFAALTDEAADADDEDGALEHIELEELR